MDRTAESTRGMLWDHLGPSTGSAPAEHECNLKTARKRRSVVGAFGALMAMSALVALIGAAPASADVNGCQPSQTIENRLPSDLVGASFTTSVNTATYEFDSLVDRSPIDGVPGLIEYCIYPGSQPPDSVTVSATERTAIPGRIRRHSRASRSIVRTATRATFRWTARRRPWVPPPGTAASRRTRSSCSTSTTPTSAMSSTAATRSTCWVLPSGTPPP